MKTTIYTKKHKNAFIKRHDVASLLPELDKALIFDFEQLVLRNSAEINRTLRIAALRNSDTDRLTELGQSVLHFVLATVKGVEWNNGRVALKKDDVLINTELAFTAYMEQAKQAAEKKAKENAEKAEREQAEALAKKQAAAAEKQAAAVQAKQAADKDKQDEAKQAAAAAAQFEAEAAQAKIVTRDRNISVKAAQSMLNGIVAGNLKTTTLQDVNDVLHLLRLAQQALARQAAKVPNVEADESRVEELSKTKATGKEKTAPKKQMA